MVGWIQPPLNGMRKASDHRSRPVDNLSGTPSRGTSVKIMKISAERFQIHSSDNTCNRDAHVVRGVAFMFKFPILRLICGPRLCLFVSAATAHM